ncbi:MAG: hypothetical protein ABIS06_20710 [Vicinamibacterales bacterium]
MTLRPYGPGEIPVEHNIHDRSRHRLAAEQGIPPERVDVVLNAVALRRFHPRPPLPPAPARAPFRHGLIDLLVLAALAWYVGEMPTCPQCRWRVLWRGVVRSWRRFDGVVITSTFHARCWRRFPQYKRVSTDD